MQERRQVAPRQVRPPDGAGEECVADEEVRGIASFDAQTDAPWAMSWRVMDLRRKITEADHFPR
jgi:hypothetical protein